jgi:hypothetical protein
MEHSAPEAEPKRRITVLQWMFIAIITCTVTLISVRQFNAAKPQLDIKNTGSTAVTVLHGGDTLIVKPGQTWHFRFWPGDAITSHAEDPTVPSQTMILERRGMEPGMLSTVPVEVRFDETSKDIVLEYTGYE